MVSLALSGCGARSPLVCPTPPANDAAALDAARFDASAADAAPDTGRCSVLLHVDSIDVPFGCVIDLQVGHDATLAFPCTGGAAMAVFPIGTFAGTVTAGQVDLVLDTTFTPGDGCVWQSHQQIVGDLNTGALSYQYDEMPAPGQRGCLPPCPIARAVVATPDGPHSQGPSDASLSTITSPCAP